MQTVVETNEYLRDAKRARLSEDSRKEIVEFIAKKPFAGVEISGTGGARKLRFSNKGKGKSGGFRIITFYSGRDMPVFLLNIFSKGDKVNLTMAERNGLKKVLGAVAKAYKERKQGQ